MKKDQSSMEIDLNNNDNIPKTNNDTRLAIKTKFRVEQNQEIFIQGKIYEYFVKFHEFSYLHCEWIKEEDILSMGKTGKNKLNRFNRAFDKKITEKEIE